MGSLEKLQRIPPPTSTDPVKDQTTSPPLDLEKPLVQGEEVKSIIPTSHESCVLPDTERKVVRKMDFRIVPLVMALYVLSFLDRSNIGKYVIFGTCASSSFGPDLEACLGSPYSEHKLQGWLYRLK